MIDRRIDLTENMDFSAQSAVTLISVMDVDADDMITPEQHEAVLKKESIFGKSIHRNEKRNVFSKAYENQCIAICAGCGRLIRSPWLLFRPFCNDCNLERQAYNSLERMPWEMRLEARVREEDIFSLR